MKYIVTGGNGRVGRVLLRVLASLGYEAVSLDVNLPDEASRLPNTRYIQNNLMDDRVLAEIFAGSDGVAHLGAIPTIMNQDAAEVYANNTVSSYNVLAACANAGVKKVCLASSVNAIGGVYSRSPRYDYFPVDEQHPTYNEDAYSLGKWVGEAQADSFARLHAEMTISSLRFHAMIATESGNIKRPGKPELQGKDLWGYTNIVSGARACVLALQATFVGHEVFFVVAPCTCLPTDTAEIVQRFYPNVPVREKLIGNVSLYSSQKAERLLGWVHEDLSL